MTVLRNIFFTVLMLIVNVSSSSEELTSGARELQRTINPDIALNAYADERLIREAANDALRSRLDSIKKSNDRQIRQNEEFLTKAVAIDRFNVELLNRQLVYHPIILATVLVLVLTATVLVVAQFRRWNRTAGEDSALEISKDGIKLKTPFVGLIMLIASYAFFYLYIEKVYEIRPLMSTKGDDVAGH